MSCATLLLCLVSLAQITPPIPDGTTIFTVTLKDGTEYAAAIRARNQFIDDFDPRTLPSQLEMVRDQPWNGFPSETVVITNVERAEREPKSSRGLRYSSSGYLEVSGVWISKETDARAKRLGELQAEQRASEEDRYAAGSASLVLDEPESSAPGVFTLWGRHVAVLAIAIFAVIFTVKICF